MFFIYLYVLRPKFVINAEFLLPITNTNLFLELFKKFKEGTVNLVTIELWYIHHSESQWQKFKSSIDKGGSFSCITMGLNFFLSIKLEPFPITTP